MIKVIIVLIFIGVMAGVIIRFLVDYVMNHRQSDEQPVLNVPNPRAVVPSAIEANERATQTRNVVSSEAIEQIEHIISYAIKRGQLTCRLPVPKFLCSEESLIKYLEDKGYSTKVVKEVDRWYGPEPIDTIVVSWDIDELKLSDNDLKIIDALEHIKTSELEGHSPTIVGVNNAELVRKMILETSPNEFLKFLIENQVIIFQDNRG